MKNNKIKKIISSLILSSMFSFPTCAENIINISNLIEVMEQNQDESKKIDELRGFLKNIDHRIEVLEKKIHILKDEYLSIGEFTDYEMAEVSGTIFDLCSNELNAIWNILELKLDKDTVKELSKLKFEHNPDIITWNSYWFLTEAPLIRNRLYGVRNFVAKLVGSELVEPPVDTDWVYDWAGEDALYEDVHGLDNLAEIIRHRAENLVKKFRVLKKYFSIYEITEFEQSRLGWTFWQLCDSTLNKIWKILKLNLNSDGMKKLTKSELEWIKDKSKYDPENNNWDFSSHIKVSDLTISRLFEISNFVSSLS